MKKKTRGAGQEGTGMPANSECGFQPRGQRETEGLPEKEPLSKGRTPCRRPDPEPSSGGTEQTEILGWGVLAS